MKKYTCLIILSVLVLGCKKEHIDDPQPIYDTLFNGVYLDSQQEVDSFGLLIGTYDKVGIENLTITDESINSLASLNNKISSVYELKIEETSLKSLIGLDSILWTTFVIIQHNPLLENLAVDFTDTVIYLIQILDNPFLKNLDGFLNVTETAWVVIKENKSLNSLTGFSNIVKIGEFSISANDTLNSLNGLESINLIWPGTNGEINIHDNRILNDLCALSSVISNDRFNVSIERNKFNPTIEDFNLGLCKLE